MASTTVELPLAEFSQPHNDNPARESESQEVLSTLLQSRREKQEYGWREELPVSVPALADTGGEIEQANLPRVDGGKDAWLFLAGCFMIEALVWGEWDCFFP
jgi:hypothetical protein